MKAVLLFFLLLCTCVRAQNSEFVIHDNGYIYPEKTMRQLSGIVDSLNLQFTVCPVDRMYEVPAQTMASCYTLKGSSVNEVANHLRGELTEGVVEVSKIFPKAELERRGILYESSRSEGDAAREWNLLPLNFGRNISLDKEGEGVLKIDEHLYIAPTHEAVRIWVLDDQPKTRALPEAYARMLQYVDCMVDTSQNIYRETATQATGGYLQEEQNYRAGEKLVKLADRYPAERPDNIWEAKQGPTEAEYIEWEQKFRAYQSGQIEWVKSQARGKTKIAQALEKTIEQINRGYTVGERAEEYLEACGEYSAALESKRLRKVYGSCSMDNSPRIHAAEIARLSAAAVAWPVFLRAHLNIMNDRFDRVTDGSYAYGGRGTYLAELEALGIDAAGLLIGSCLQARGLSDNHYRSSWSRVGRALAESREVDAVVARIKEMIRDPELDDLNRMTGVYLLRFMANHPGQKETDERYLKALRDALKGLDDEWAQRVKL